MNYQNCQLEVTEEKQLEVNDKNQVQSKIYLGVGKKQAGLMGLAFIELFAVFAILVGIAASFLYPMIKNGQETAQATKIILGFQTLTQAAYDSPYGVASNYTGIKFSDLPDYLPATFSQRAENGEDYEIKVNSNPTRFDASLDIPNDRVRARVMSKYDSSQYTVTGTTFTITGP